MKPGDLIKYMTGDIAVAIEAPNEGGTAKVLLNDGTTTWYVVSECEVLSETRRQEQ